MQSPSQKDKDILRQLAGRRAEIAGLSIHAEKAELWRRVNDREPVRPMVYINEEPFGELEQECEELICRCEDPFLRSIEKSLRVELFRWDNYPVDMIVRPVIDCPKAISSTGIGISQKGETIAHDSIVAQHFDAQISEMEDIDKIKTPEVTHDEKETERRMEILTDIMDDLAPVRPVGTRHIWFTPWDNLIRLVDIQSIMMDLIERPEFIDALVSRYVDARMHELDQFEELGLLDAGAANVRVGSGAYGYTRELPEELPPGETATCQQMWGCGNAQIFSDVSPEMHWELSLKHEIRWLERWGMTYYGCCEPRHNKIEILRRIPNLRKISVSPWFDVTKGLEEGADEYVLSVKPNPAIMATDQFNEKQARKGIAELLDKTRGCAVELIMKDISTVRHDPSRLTRWAEIAMDEARKHT
jgi:hypothetical protein